MPADHHSLTTKHDALSLQIQLHNPLGGIAPLTQVVASMENDRAAEQSLLLMRSNLSITL